MQLKADLEASGRSYGTRRLVAGLRARGVRISRHKVRKLMKKHCIDMGHAPHMKAELVCRALQMPITCRQPPPGLLIHSDRGSQYASQAYRDLIAAHALVQSMSRKGNCWDNAVMERFFLNLKMERVWQADYTNHGEAMRDVADYIVGFYNSVRLHSTLGYLSPIGCEQLQAGKKLIGVSEKG